MLWLACWKKLGPTFRGLLGIMGRGLLPRPGWRIFCVRRMLLRLLVGGRNEIFSRIEFFAWNFCLARDCGFSGAELREG